MLLQIKSNNGQTALHIAIEDNNSIMLEKLLEKKPDTGIVDDKNNSIVSFCNKDKNKLIIAMSNKSY